MAKKYFMEADGIEIDVQVGPEKEEETVADPVEAVPNPVELAKAKPENVPVACEKKEDGVCEFYVDAADVDKYATYAKCGSMLEALNNIIAANEGSGLRADNLTVVVNESTRGFVRNLERHGAACMMIHEADESAAADDIEIDVQVGPNDEETEVKADPQEANPVDAVKREYDNVVIAQKDKEFFMDVEDVQKCAELNCESVIATLNKIIATHEDSKMDASNIVLVANESADEALVESLIDSGVTFFVEAGTTLGDVSGLTQLTKKMVAVGKKAVNKIKGDPNADSKYIKEQIDALDEQIKRIDEEIAAAYDKGFKVKAGRIAKNFFGFLLSYVQALIVSGGITGGVAVGVMKVFRVPAQFIKIWLKSYGITLAGIGAVVGTVASAVETAAFLNDYEKSLQEWKKNLVDAKKDLERKYEGTKKSEDK